MRPQPLRLMHRRPSMGTSVFKAAARVFLHNERKSFQFHVACLGKPIGSGLVGPGGESQSRCDLLVRSFVRRSTVERELETFLADLRTESPAVLEHQR